MCITSARAHLSNTIVYAGEALRDGILVHVLGYQNKAENLFGGPNAMILPIPARAPMGPENMIDTRAAPRILKDMEAAIHLDSLTLSRGFGDERRTRSKSVQVFDQGSYTVVLADRPTDVMAALSQVTIERRPSIGGDLLASFERFYPEWPLAVCCFNGRVAPEPLLWWYEPKDPGHLWAPALDAHDGAPPVPGMLVDVDHTVVFGSSLQAVPGAAEVRYTEPPSSIEPLKSLLPGRVTGKQLHKMRLPNGDFSIDRTMLGTPGKMKRVPPPGGAFPEGIFSA